MFLYPFNSRDCVSARHAHRAAQSGVPVPLRVFAKGGIEARDPRFPRDMGGLYILIAPPLPPMRGERGYGGQTKHFGKRMKGHAKKGVNRHMRRYMSKLTSLALREARC